MKNIFISSTFRDMQAERDMVQERVLPALREEARKYGDNVGVIDLRWGVDTSTLETEEGAAKVLKVCLDEIDRSHPYMLIFLGERYGWIPNGTLIEKAVRGREDKYVTDDYAKSVTALEIEYGALSEKYGEMEHCIVCFREPVVHMLDGAEKNLYAEQIWKGKMKLRALKKKIKRSLGKTGHLITYSCTWDTSAHQLTGFLSNGQPLEEVLTNCFVEMFRDDWKEYEKLSWQDKEQLAFRALMESKLRSFVGREELLEEYYQSAVNGTCPIILRGEVGSGKTAIMCKLVERLQKEGKNIFAFFSGAGGMSTNAESLVKQMVYYMEKLLGIEEHFGEVKEAQEETDDVTEGLFRSNKKGTQYDEWMERLGDLCSQLLGTEKVYFCIDALDQLFLDEHVEKLDFFVSGNGVQIIASCTDEFVLPMEAVTSRVVKNIPALNEGDAKTVAEGILASYSRNAYVAIEEEILKKKSIGNPLYISLLIQRLNMMDAEELRKAMSEEEIVVLGTGVIREMPEQTEDAIVAVIRNGIDKISDEEEGLYEILEYLAVSRNGLRMSDLQGIFASLNRSFPVLDFTLLMKYLDGFFYVHEDNRIDFTHKVIRQGLLKGMVDRDAKEEMLKEHLKTLDEADGLRLREGMYFARISKDEEFAKRLIEQAYRYEEEVLVKAIKNEAVADGGEFYCSLIEKETSEKSLVQKFFLWSFPEYLGYDRGEMRVRLAIGDVLIACMECLHKKQGSEMSIRDLSASYNNMGNSMQGLGRSRDALTYYEKALRCTEELHRKQGSEVSLRGLIVNYNNIGDALQGLGQSREALTYSEKALGCAEELHKKQGSEASLRDLVVSYNNMGHALRGLGQLSEALMYYEKALMCAEDLHRKQGSEASLRDLAVSYNNMGNALQELGRSRGALTYYEKALRHKEDLHRKQGSEASLRALSAGYNNIGHALRELGQSREALTYYEKALMCAEDLHRKQESEASLRVLPIRYSNMGHALRGLGQLSEALMYYEKALMCAEDLHRKQGSEASLRVLSVRYSNIGNVLQELGQSREALTYYEKALRCEEELHRKQGSEKSLRDLSVSYGNMGNILQELGQSRDALTYCEKMLTYMECLHEKQGSEKSLRDLSVSHSNIGNVLCDLGQYEEARMYYEKNLRGREELYRLSTNDSNLNNLSAANNNCGWILCELERYEEALKYLEKALQYAEKLHQKNPMHNSKSSLAICQRNLAKALLGVNRLQEALEYSKKSVDFCRELYSQDDSDKAKERVIKSLSIYAEILLTDNRIEAACEAYTETLGYCKTICEKNDSIPNLRFNVKALKGIYLSLDKMGRIAEAREYLALAKEEGKKLYERSGAEQDKKLLEEILCY